MRVFDQDQKGKLSGMCNHGNEQNRVARSKQRNAVIACVTNGIHGMRCDLVDTVKGQLLIGQEEEVVAPIP